MQRKSSNSVRIYYPRLTREEVVKTLKEKAKRLNQILPLKEAYLIGSYAKGNYTAASDIDLLIVYKGKDPDAYRKAYTALRIPGLQLLTYSCSKYRQMKRENPASVRMLLNNAVKLL